MKRIIAFAVLAASIACCASSLAAVEAHQARPFRIVLVDAEGGGAMLIATPAGESILIDCGSPCPDARDAKRIVAAAAALGIERIDHLIITHYHSDHIGGIGQLAERIPIPAFYDRGPCDGLAEDPRFASYWADYRKAREGKARTTLSAGDWLPLARATTPPVEVRCVAARREVIGGATPCIEHRRDPLDASDNAESIALLIRFGDFRFFHGGDITRNVEHDLVCPKDRIGPVDLYYVAHHGFAVSNHPLLIRTLDPVVAIMANGARKGGHRRVREALKACPSFRAIWQAHENLADKDANPPPEFIANKGGSACEGIPIVVEVDPGATAFSVRCGFEGAPKQYPVLGRGT
ncbi:MAG: MBL fold metallo-hydrolase [Planctomycetes bacterium]|nr:MBL fold metallo-hydrolase [Planctomycetota bacterium]